MFPLISQTYEDFRDLQELWKAAETQRDTVTMLHSTTVDILKEFMMLDVPPRCTIYIYNITLQIKSLK